MLWDQQKCKRHHNQCGYCPFKQHFATRKRALSVLLSEELRKRFLATTAAALLEVARMHHNGLNSSLIYRITREPLAIGGGSHDVLLYKSSKPGSRNGELVCSSHRRSPCQLKESILMIRDLNAALSSIHGILEKVRVEMY